VALTDEAIGKIKEMIISGRVRPGEKLPKEADLAAELGLSRNSLREAVKALTLVNVLDVRQGDGTYATSLAPSLLLEALSFIIDFHRDDTVLEFFEVRRILEPSATGLAAVRMSPEEKAELGKILDAVTVESPVDDFVATDLEFHKKIAVGSGNSVLASLVDNMSLPTARARIFTPTAWSSFFVSSLSRDFSTRTRATPPPGTTPSSTAARVACRASSTRAFFSFISISVAAPTLITATPPESFATRSCSFSLS